MSAQGQRQEGARTGPHNRRVLGTPRLHLRLTDSTNSRARELALAGAPHGTIVTAAEQSAGRGRQGRTWSAPAGSSLLLSVLLREPPQMLPLAAAVAVAEVVGEAALIKWPNDVVVERAPEAGAATERRAAGSPPALAKVAGILVEGRLQAGWAVLGIGLNVAVRLEDLPAELRPGGSRPAATMGRPPRELEATLATLLDELERRLAEPAGATLEAWRRRDALIGREIAWSGGSGVARGLDGAGRLIVEESRGRRTALAAGEVHLRRVG
ncbi:MAG TPA: biotin--[acetyl-CoA-carboxylase] ligase [Solirubrobacteraceae bacterium]|nr:biotin--[acetyl-CoA-carboxylase] ligase [Solirubrobacteraceae bacterium]